MLLVSTFPGLVFTRPIFQFNRATASDSHRCIRSPVADGNFLPMLRFKRGDISVSHA
jgi:hypothetical protein